MAQYGNVKLQGLTSPYEAWSPITSAASPLALSPLLTPVLLQSPCCSLNTPGLLLPQCLCTGHSFCLKQSSPGCPGGPFPHLLYVFEQMSPSELGFFRHPT